MVLNTFTKRDDDGVVVAPSLQIALYSNQPRQALAAGAVACYRLMTKQFSSERSEYLAESMRRSARFTAKAATVFPSLCRKPGIALPAFRVFNGASLHDCSPPFFATGAYASWSWMQVHLPPEVIAERKRFDALLMAMTRAFHYRAGTVGYSLCWNELSVVRSNQVPRVIGALLKRYPGLNTNARELCDQPLPPVNWLTLLGPSHLKALGGALAVKRHFAKSTGVRVAQFGDGLGVQAGPTPDLGDAKRNTLPLYRHVGSFVKALRGTQEIELDGLTLRASKKWLARFDA